MGAWGPKTFEEDTALDWISELEDSDDPRSFLLESLSLKPGYVESDVCSAVMASCETIVAILDEPRPGMPEELVDWVGDNDCDDISDLPEIALKSLGRVMGKNSEMRELWEETDGYDEWRAEVEQLKEILEQLAQL